MAKLLLIALLPLLSLAIKSEKSDELRHLSALSEDNIIQLNSTGYHHYVLDYPRPYTLIILFTADPLKYKCKTCEEIQENLKTIVYSYREAKADYPSVSTEGQRSRAVFFATLEYVSENRDLYKLHGFQSIPNILVTHPKSIYSDGVRLTVPKEDVWEFSMASEVPLHKLMDFVNSRTNRSIELKFTAFQIIGGLLKWCILIFIATTVVFKLRRFIINPYVMFLLFMAIYYLCISGTIYTIINHSPMTGGNRKTGNFELIHRGYGAEGFLMGFLISIGALSIIFIGNLDKLKSQMAMRICSMVALFFFLFSLYELDSIYKYKAQWYKPDFFPPRFYTKGPYYNDQGTSF